MTKQEMIRYIDAAEGVPDALKAIAIPGIILMRKKAYKQFSALADKGLAMLLAGDYDGIVRLLEEENATPDVLSAVKAVIDAHKARN